MYEENVENGVETTPADRQLKTVVQQATQRYCASPSLCKILMKDQSKFGRLFFSL